MRLVQTYAWKFCCRVGRLVSSPYAHTDFSVVAYSGQRSSKQDLEESISMAWSVGDQVLGNGM